MGFDKRTRTAGRKVVIFVKETALSACKIVDIW